jgi:hypothetical protein
MLIYKSLIFNTAYRKAVFLMVATPGYTVATAAHAPTPDVSCRVLGRRPPVAVFSNVVVWSIVVSATARKGSKVSFVSC